MQVIHCDVCKKRRGDRLQLEVSHNRQCAEDDATGMFNIDLCDTCLAKRVRQFFRSGYAGLIISEKFAAFLGWKGVE